MSQPKGISGFRGRKKAQSQLLGAAVFGAALMKSRRFSCMQCWTHVSTPPRPELSASLGAHRTAPGLLPWDLSNLCSWPRGRKGFSPHPGPGSLVFPSGNPSGEIKRCQTTRGFFPPPPSSYKTVAAAGFIKK